MDEFFHKTIAAARRTAVPFARRGRLDPDDCVGVALLALVVAFRKWGPEADAALTLIRRRLIDFRRAEHRRAHAELWDVHHARPRFDLGEFLEPLSADARTAVRAALTVPLSPRPRTAAKETLRSAGWSGYRVRRAFAEVRSKL